MLELRDVSLSFGGVKAVDGLSFTVNPGEIFCLIGPNGAGKSTVFNIISRLYQPDTGQLTYNNENLLGLKSHQLAKSGICRTFQNIELFDRASLLQNLLIAQFSRAKTSIWSDLGFLKWTKNQEWQFRQRAEEMIDFFELAPYRHSMVGQLPYGVRKLTELARSMCLLPKLILLDEPSSGLNQEETDDLSHWIIDIKEEFGVTVVMVDHNMPLVHQVADRVLAMAEGRFLAEGSAAEVQAHPKVLKAYLGEDHE